MNETPAILLAGGGTGGHLFPALAIADEIRRQRPGARFLFLGTKHKIEARVVPQRGYPFRTIWISGFNRRLLPANLLFPLKVAVSLIQSFLILRNFKPDIVIGTGGYVCGPVLKAASMMGIPTVIHESNSYPGATTRLLAEHMTKVYTAFEATDHWLKQTNNVEMVGTPVRAALLEARRPSAAQRFGLDPHKPTVLVFGGSLGATSINAAMQVSVPLLLEAGMQLIWQTGIPDYKHSAASVAMSPSLWVGAFIDKMEDAYAASDMVVCRAGATTIAELTVLGKPAILVPYPHAAADHQTMNAQTLSAAGAARMLRDDEVRIQLVDAIRMLMQDAGRRERMAEASRRLGRPDAGIRIAASLFTLIDRERSRE